MPYASLSQQFCLSIVVLTVSLACVTDLRSRRIPNWLVVPFLMAGLLESTVLGGWAGLERSVLGFLIGATLMGVLWRAGGMGMGDVKLCAAVGAWLGPAQLVRALIYMGIAGGLMSLVWLAKAKLESLRVDTSKPMNASITVRRKSMPYAPAIAFGVICSFWSR